MKLVGLIVDIPAEYIENTCNPYFVMHVHVIYSVFSGQHSFTIYYFYISVEAFRNNAEADGGNIFSEQFGSFKN